jgi:DNA-binding response OmpR family regulator
MSTILIAEDNPMTLKMVESKLMDHGYSVLQATNGQDALNLAQSSKPALILLDCMMPVMDGVEVLRRLKDSAELKFIPVIMLTFKGKDQDIDTCLKLGAIDYFVKPISLSVVLARIHKILGEDTKSV